MTRAWWSLPLSAALVGFLIGGPAVGSFVGGVLIAAAAFGGVWALLRWRQT